MSDSPSSPATLSGWYSFSRGERLDGRRRADYFAQLHKLTDGEFLGMVERDTNPRPGKLRPQPIARRSPPSLETLLGQLRAPDAKESELHLQYLFSYRGYIQYSCQKIVDREAPCSYESVKRPAVSDFLAFNESRRSPILVEVKRGGAKDSISGVVFEALAQWAFYKSAMAALREHLSARGSPIDPGITQPEAIIVAPENYYRRACERSSQRNHEAEQAHRFTSLLEKEIGLRIQFLAISNDWAAQGLRFDCWERELPR